MCAVIVPARSLLGLTDVQLAQDVCGSSPALLGGDERGAPGNGLHACRNHTGGGGMSRPRLGTSLLVGGLVAAFGLPRLPARVPAPAMAPVESA